MPNQNAQLSSLCADCHAHMCRVKKLVQECTGEIDSRHFYSNILEEFNSLITIPELENHPILHQYFHTMRALSTYLFNKLVQGISPHEHMLLLDGIKAGIRCCGIDNNYCPEAQQERIQLLSKKIEDITLQLKNSAP